MVTASGGGSILDFVVSSKQVVPQQKSHAPSILESFGSP